MLRICLFSLLVFGCGTPDRAPFISTLNTNSAITNGLVSKTDASIQEVNQPAQSSSMAGEPLDSGIKSSGGYIPPADSKILSGPCDATEPHVCYKVLGTYGSVTDCFLGKQICIDGDWSDCTDSTGTFHVK